MSNTIDEVLERLHDGNARFVADKLEHKLQDRPRRAALKKDGQQPPTIVLSCADSRVVPELAFDMGLGELFVIRVAGNVATTGAIASIEYAVAHLGSCVIVVLGHESCGAVTAAIAGGDNGHHLNTLLSQIEPAKALNPDGDVTTTVKSNAQCTATALVERSKVIAAAVENKTLRVVPAYYALESGEVSFL